MGEDERLRQRVDSAAKSHGDRLPQRLLRLQRADSLARSPDRGEWSVGAGGVWLRELSGPGVLPRGRDEEGGLCGLHGSGLAAGDATDEHPKPNHAEPVH